MKKGLLVIVLMGWVAFAEGQTISIGPWHSLFLCDTYLPKSCGDNSYGALGNTSIGSSNHPLSVTGLSGITAVSTGTEHSVFLKNDGTVWACGENDYGELGDGTYTQRNTVVQVSGISNVVKILGTAWNSFFIKSDGTVWGCGQNNGAFGHGSYGQTNVPVKAIGLNGIISVAGGTYHGIFLKSDGTVWASGENPFGQLGDSLISNTAVPVQIPSLSGIIAISAGGVHSLFLKNDGTVWACGDNSNGQLGDGTTTNRWYPVQVLGLSNIIGIDGASANSFFLKSDGTVWGCGNNSAGQLGDGTTTQRNTAVQTVGISSVTYINAGGYACLYQINDGTVWGCGDNSSGQLSDGTWTERHSPVQCQSLCTVLSPYSISFIQTNVSCNGGNNGSVTAIPSGGSIPYTYSWSTGATTATINNLSAGNYSITVTDNSGNTVTQSVTIIQPAVLSINFTTNNATCSSCNNGVAVASPIGGTAPYTYSWSPVSSTMATVSNILPGNYTCCVTDAYGCSTCSGVTVNYNCVVPSTQATNITFTNVTSNSITVNWTNGNGSRRIVKIKTTNSFTAPVNGVDYVANPTYLGGEQTVYNGTGNSVTVTGLAPHHIYWFEVYEASCSASNSQYLTTSATGNPRNRITAPAPPSSSPSRPEAAAEVSSVHIFPNPTTGFITIESAEGNLIQSINVYGTDGRIVKSIVNCKLSTVNLDVQSLSAGVYFLDCLTENGREKLKVVKY